MQEFTYIQGSADDEEAWSHGLKSDLFWEYHRGLLEYLRETDLVARIREIVTGETNREVEKEEEEDVSGIRGMNLRLGIGRGDCMGKTMIICGGMENGFQGLEENFLFVDLPKKGKCVTYLTKTIFPKTVEFAFDQGILKNHSITILSINSSRENLDLSIAIMLILLSLFFNDNGTSPPPPDFDLVAFLIDRRCGR